MAGQRCSPYLPSISLRPPGSDLKRSKTTPRGFQRHSRQLQEGSRLLFFGSRGLQEPFKRPSAGIMGLQCDSGAIFYRFSPLQGGLGTSKIIKIHRTVCKFQGFAICNLSGLLTPIWERLGRLLGGFLEPKIAETGSWRPPGPKKSYIERLLDGPRRISRQVSAILGTKKLPTGSPGPK